MKSLLIVLSALVVACVAHEFQAIQDLAWAGWKVKYNKSYTGVEEEIRRKIWENNLLYIEEFNAEEHSYKLGPNHFADLTNLEYRQIYLGYDNEARLNCKNKRESIPHKCTMNKEDLPSSVDWREKGIVTPVKNQKQCGSCWAFSATGSLEGQYAIKNGKLVPFSEQELVDCSISDGNHGCQGGLMDNAFKWLETKLEETEVAYPYTAKNGHCNYDSSKGVVGDSGYKDIATKDCDALKEACATVGTISVAMDASHTSFQLYMSGIYDPLFCSSTRLDHGVLIVGYDVEDSKDFFWVKNSWSEKWGEKGYFKMINRDNKCGLCTSPSYPTL